MLTAASLMFPYLFGLGCFLFMACGSLKGESAGYDDSERMQLFASTLVFGILLNHAAVLLLADLKPALLSGVALSAAGYGWFLLCSRKGVRIITSPWLAIFATLYLACLFVVLVEPVSGWDARSIWFFHGKMIFYHASIDAGGGWSNPLIGFSHPDYPKLVPILAAQTAFVAGYWNEYLPKMGLVALLAPALFCLMSILKKRWHLPLIALPLLFTNVWLKNGYMDGYLALYAGLAAYYWGKWLDQRRHLDLVSGILLASVVLCLKNEGKLYALVVAGLLLLFALPGRKRVREALKGRYAEAILLPLFSLSGVFLWERKKQIFELRNDLGLGINSLVKLKERLADGSLKVILRHLYVTESVSLSFGILMLSLAVALAAGRRPGVGTLFCALTGIFYLSGIILIYLATPYDLISFHLPTADRTMLPVHLIFLAAAFTVWRDAGENEGVRG